MGERTDLAFVRLRTLQPIGGEVFWLRTYSLDPNPHAIMFKAQVRAIADAGQLVTLIMQMLRKQKLPRALRKARRFPVGEFSDKIFVGETKARVGLPKPCEFGQRPRAILKLVRKESTDARIKSSEFCSCDHLMPLSLN
ncbi:hypothetical protein BOSE125_590003 [Bosea sp. 125]|nr:hypothetical protein BOSE125_590003 [Bosea sp. 125]